MNMIRVGKVTGKMQVTIPKDVGSYLGLKTGDKLEFLRHDRNSVIIRKYEEMCGCAYCNKNIGNSEVKVINEEGKEFHEKCWERYKNKK